PRSVPEGVGQLGFFHSLVFLPGQRADFGGAERAAKDAELVEIASEVVRVQTVALLEPIKLGAESAQVRGDSTAGEGVLLPRFECPVEVEGHVGALPREGE